MLKPKFFEAVPYSVEALCEKCGKSYWLSDRYPVIVHAFKESSIQVDGYPPIEFEEYEDAK